MVRSTRRSSMPSSGRTSRAGRWPACALWNGGTAPSRCCAASVGRSPATAMRWWTCTASCIRSRKGGADAMEADRPLVSLRRVTKTYANGTTALRDVSFDVASGEFVSLVGPSGCGKSTLLRLVAGLGDSSAGTVVVEGLAPARARAERGDMAFVFQEATLLPWRTVRANVALPLELKGKTAAARRAACREALEMVGLGDVAAQYPRQL